MLFMGQMHEAAKFVFVVLKMRENWWMDYVISSSIPKTNNLSPVESSSNICPSSVKQQETDTQCRRLLLTCPFCTPQACIPGVWPVWPLHQTVCPSSWAMYLDKGTCIYKEPKELVWLTVQRISTSLLFSKNVLTGCYLSSLRRKKVWYPD